MPSASSGAVNFASINSDMDPSTPNVFDIGKIGAEWRNARIGGDLVIGGSLTVEGPITTIESITLTIEDKNIELASVVSPTDILADGGGITLKGDTDKTILWKDSTDSWDFNQPIRTGNLELNGNTIFSTDVNGDITLSPNGSGKVAVGNLRLNSNILSTINGDLDITTQTGGVFKFVDNAFRSGQDGSNYLEIGHGGANSFVNQVGVGGMDFRFGGNTKATFTPAGHLHLLTDVDQKHTLKIKTASNLDETGIAWENSGGSFTHTIFRTDVGSNRADLVFAAGQNTDIDLLINSFKIHGSAANEGKLEVIAALQISIGTPAINDVWTTIDTLGNGAWVLPSGGGWVDDGTVVRLATSSDSVGIGTASPQAPLQVSGPGGVNVGGFPSGILHVTSDSSTQFRNAVITGHNLFGGNTQLWYLGSVSGSNDDIALINRQAGSLSLQTSGNGDILLTPNGTGNVGIGTATPDTKLHVTDGGSAGVVTAFAGTIATFESPGNGFLSLLTPDASVRGILFGEPSGNVAGGIFYNDPGSPDGFQFRVNGNVTKMVIESDGIGIGTTNPDVTALLDINSTTKGFLPPRMTTTQIDAIASPATGLESYDTTINKKKVFTGAEFKTLLTEDIGQVLVQETFASTNVRFFGELALPAAQGWTDVVTTIATIDLVTQTVFGEVKQVVRHNDDSNGSTTSEIVLTTQNWIDINAFGASYGGTSRLDTVDGGSGFFSGLQANSAENPLATGNRRYGVVLDNNGGNLRLKEADLAPTVTMDGTGGNPLITFDEWFSWEVVIPPGLGVAEFYINGILTTFAPTFTTNTGGLGTAIKVGSGSSSGVNRIVYHDNFGVTIYEAAATKTLAVATMAGDVAQVNIPEGKRDYTIVLPDGSPRSIGAVLRLVASNLLGSISLENQNPAAPEVLYNGLRTLVINIAVKETIEGINTVSSGNVYLGFQTSDIDRTKSIFIQLSSSVDQDPADTNPTVITYNTQDAIAGLTHSTTVNSGEITVVTEGVYFISPQPQVGKTSGATKTDFDIFLQVDRGSGFVDESNSNIKLTIKDSDITDVAVSAIGISLNVGDKIRLMQRVSSSSVGMGLKATAAETGPPTIPATPAIILDMHRIGGLPV